MKAKTCMEKVIFFVLCLTLACTLSGATIYDRSEILKIMKKVADHHHYSSNSWFDATYYAGILAAYKVSRDTAYLNLAESWGQSNHWRGASLGADDLACGQAYAELFLLDSSAANQYKIADMINVHTTMENNSYGGWGWCDALFMAPPMHARIAHIMGWGTHFDKINPMWWRTHAGLYDTTDHLFFRDNGFLYPAKTTASGKKVFWSRGNGWVVAGTVRVLQYMPADYPDRPKYVQLLREMCAALAVRQGSDGLWRTSLLDSAQYPKPETSGSAFFCYAMAWGINNGILDTETYLPVVKKAWEGLVGKVDANGMLGYVQGENDQPGDVSAGQTAAYAVGGFLMAGSEMWVTDINIADLAFQKLQVKVFNSVDSSVLEGINIRVLRNDTLVRQVSSDGNGCNLLYLKPSIYKLVLSGIGFSPETLLNMDITNTLIDTHRVAAYLSPLPVIGLRIEPDSLVVYNNCTAGLQVFTIFEDGGRKTHPAAGLIWSSIPAGLLTVDAEGEITTGNDTGRVTIICNSTVTGFTDSCVVSFSPPSPSLYYWSLDEKGGQTASGGTCNGNTATLHGAPVWGPGKYGNSLTFDGMDDYLSTSLLQTNPNVFTLSLWFKTTSTTGGKLIGLGDAQTGTSGHYDRHLYMNNAGKIYFGCYNGGVQTLSTAIACNNGAWHNAAATLSGAGMELYIDGVLTASNTGVTSGENYSGYWRMGFDDLTGWPSAPSSNYFSGQLDDIRVYDKALSASEIALFYDGTNVNAPAVITPEYLALEASPNPFNPSACISYCLPQKAVVSLALYNLQGKLVRELVSGMVSEGRHTVQVDAGNLSSGIYICKFKSGATAKQLKLVLMR